MKNTTMKFLSVSMVLVCLLVAASSIRAQDAKAPAAAAPEATPAAAPVAAEPKAPAMPPPLELRKTGIVNVTKDASGKVTDIKLVVTSYTIILDEGSKALESMDGQKVRVTGTFSMQEGNRCFTVKSVESMTSGAAKPAPAK